MTWLILTPLLPQAQAIARTFAKAGRARDLAYGMVNGGQVLTYDPNGRIAMHCPAPMKTFDAIIPTGSLCTPFALNTFGPLRLGQITMDPSTQRWLDKLWSLTFAQEEGIVIPRTWYDTDVIPADAGRIFYKPGHEGVGGARSWARSPAELPTEVRQQNSGFIYQEMIGGPEVRSYGFLADRGKVIAGAGLIERFSYPPDGGSAVVMELAEDKALAEASHRLVAASDYNGWGLAEFKLCPRRDALVFMEINPKFWASIELVLRTHPQFAKLLFGLDVLAESFTKMWWPGRMAMQGIDHWPRKLGSISGSSIAEEKIPASSVVRALLPFRSHRKLAEGLKRAALRLRGQGGVHPSRRYPAKRER
jgi:hypothetical protein